MSDPNRFRVWWSKRERALMYDGVKATGMLVADFFEHATLSYGSKTLVKELEERGYDLTTLRLSVRRREVKQ